ncbi:MAG TPA: energy transducer TonB [Quisquiliibacterium sp.]|nr:energy transducer TonB [Quisquiliibacterium sp.]
MRTRHDPTVEIRCARGFGRRRWIAAVGGLGATAALTLSAAPARAQSFMGQLLEVLKSRIGVLGGLDPNAQPSAEYLASVYQRIINANADQLADPQRLGNPQYANERAGTATLTIEIGPGGTLLGVSVSGATGQGRALAPRAQQAVRRAAPFGQPQGMKAGVYPSRVTLDETFVFETSGRFHLQTVIDLYRNASTASGS